MRPLSLADLDCPWGHRMSSSVSPSCLVSMPDASGKPFAPRYVQPAATQEDLEWADLAIIDLSKMSTPEGRAELVKTARDAMRDIGFFYVINHGLPKEQHDRMIDIADLAFTKVDDNEKKKFEGKLQEDGTYQGYKLRQYWVRLSHCLKTVATDLSTRKHIANGVQDQIEHYNINKDITKRDHPKALKPFLPEIDDFIRYNHFNILHPILRLLALGLELPEDTLVKKFGFEAESDTWFRFMKYFPRSKEEEMKTKNVWLKGHTDFTGITILWSQPVSGLQMRRPDGSWRWIKHIDNALVINIGDSLDFISGGYYKATIHRVVQPPVDQRGLPRLGLFYFCMPDDDVRLIPVQNSPVLERVGIKRQIDDDKAPTSETLRKGRIQTYGKIKLEKGPEPGTEIQYIAGVMVRHYN
ncbi:hypothetical protein NM688_g3718 [Phlebia brevispora]|uniref:Uncharacterized protein n=1 Tax=Phlebia brevispora TaxID=194682 RepID=A0ACC1T4R1_9APHY|nr:hypothetical protein NM688_g3718 [Phlebia brevispora]